MNVLISRYPIIKGSDDERNLFKTFSNEQNLKPIEDWMENKFSNVDKVKSDSKSTEFRKQGNDHYKRKELEGSLKYYEKSLQFAKYNNCEYGMALANRSAVQFMLRDFKDCLQNIDLCLKSQYPQDMRPKLYLRKAECYYHLQMKDKLEEMILFLEKLNDHTINLRLDEFKQTNTTRIVANTIFISLPNVKNNKLIGASSKICLQYDVQRGRHVVANEDLEVGSILFVEPAFTFALIFEENGNIKANKCYHCLSDYKYGIPCKSCTFCSYCSETCRDSSWNEDHQFQCAGMLLWYDLGIGFPAFKCMLKGIKSNFKQNLHHPTASVEKFGDENDNYMYFNSLITNISLMENVTPMILMSVIIVKYLKSKTDFFDSISENMKCEDFESFIGGLIIRHISQLECNSSIIEHWSTKFPLNENSQLESCMEPKSIINLDECKPVACGIFPTLSMMNHSCKSNISMYFIKDTVIIKAGQLIRRGEEIFNCYGLDYESMDKITRQQTLQALYHFKCECVVCSNPEEEYNNMFNCFLCEKCNGKMELRHENNYFCNRCNYLGDATMYNKLEDRTLFVLNKSRKLEELLGCLQEMEKRFYKYHDYFYECYIKLMKFSADKGDIEKYENYKRKIYELVRRTHGIYSKKFALLWYDTEIDKRFDGKCVDDVLKLFYPIEEIIIR